MVNDIVGALEVEHRELIRQPLDLSQLVRTALTDLRVAAEKADLVLSAEIVPELPLVSGDAMALRRVLDNLVSNALKFTPAGGRVTLRSVSKCRDTATGSGRYRHLAFPPISWIASLSVFTRWTAARPGSMAGWAWGWRWRKTLSKHTADKSPWRARLELERPLRLCCLSSQV